MSLTLQALGLVKKQKRSRGGSALDMKFLFEGTDGTRRGEMPWNMFGTMKFAMQKISFWPPKEERV